MKHTSASAITSRLVTATLIPLVMAGCSFTREYARPDMPVPAQWEATVVPAGAQTVAPDWWKRFGSAELDSLIDRAMLANQDLAAAVSRIEQARASLGITRGSLAPSVSGSASTSGSAQRGGGFTSSGTDTQALLSVNYELDLRGSLAAQVDSAQARANATAIDRVAVALLVQSEVAANYFQWLALQDRLVIARKNLEAAQQLMALVQVRFDNGAATALDVSQQRTTMLTIQAQIPALEQSLAQTRTALAVLLGQAPQGFTLQGQTLSGLVLPGVDAGQPAALLERRPDIRRAEAQLLGASADIAAARAALYPKISLSAAAGVQGLLTGGTSVFASIAASLAQTIFDGGRLKGQVLLAEGARKELVANYAQTVLTGLKEVQDSLVAVATSDTRSGILTETAAQAQQAYRLATIRYEAGIQDLLTLLDSQRTQLSAQDSLVQAQLNRYTAAVSLFKALGGGWNGAV